MSSIQYILEDLRKASRVFDSEAKEFDKTAQQTPRSGPDTGDGALNSTLSAVLNNLGFLQQSLATRTESHGTKLAKVASNYATAEEDIVQELRKLQPDA